MFANRVQVPAIITIDFRKGYSRNFTSHYAIVRNKKFLQQAALLDGILFKSTSSANSQNVCFGLKSVNPLFSPPQLFRIFFFFIFIFLLFQFVGKETREISERFLKQYGPLASVFFFPSPLTYIFRPCSTFRWKASIKLTSLLTKRQLETLDRHKC